MAEESREILNVFITSDAFLNKLEEIKNSTNPTIGDIYVINNVNLTELAN